MSYKASPAKVVQTFCTKASQSWLGWTHVRQEGSALQHPIFDRNLKIVEDFFFKNIFQNSNYQHCVKKVVFRGFPILRRSNVPNKTISVQDSIYWQIDSLLNVGEQRFAFNIHIVM